MPNRNRSAKNNFQITINTLSLWLNNPPTEIDCAINGFSVDTRTLEKGDVYLCIEGEHQDGHDFINDAISKGAVAVILRKSMLQHADVHYIYVEDTTKALQIIAHNIRKLSNAIHIAITGSVGKTTTKDMLAHILKHFGETVAAKASYNNHWGVPLSLLNLKPSTQYGVFEVGMSHKGEIAPLSKLVSPEIALITAIGEAHIGEFKCTKAVAIEKASIFEGFMESEYASNLAVINGDSPHFEILEDTAKRHAKNLLVTRMRYSADVQLKNTYEGYIEMAGYTEVRAVIREQEFFYTIPLIGEHYVQNSLLVLAVCYALHLDMEKVCKLFASYVLPTGRGIITFAQISSDVFISLIDDAYNANPTSMRAGLKNFGHYPLLNAKETIRKGQCVTTFLQENISKENINNNNTNIHVVNTAATESIDIMTIKPRKIAVLGDMLELGENSEKYHRELARDIEKNKIDAVFCCGKEMLHLFQALPLHKRAFYTHKAEQLIEPLLEYLRNGDMVYVKGSKASRVSKIVDYFYQNNLFSFAPRNPFT